MWADSYIEKLQKGETVSFRPRGNSMSGRIESGQLCTVEPTKAEELKVGDVVLCKVKGSQYVHLITQIGQDKFLISNNKGHDNGWIRIDKIYGKVTKVV